MSTDLVPHPLTGEAIDLTASDDALAFWVDQLRDFERRAKDVRDLIGEELVRRMDKSARWTIRANGFKVTAPSPAPKVEWDVDALRPVLSALLADGAIGEEAADAALEIVVSYKPRAAGLNALMKLGGVVAERLAECRSEVAPVRRVSVRSEREGDEWTPCDPCGHCGSTDTYGEAGSAGCRTCGSHDWDDD